MENKVITDFSGFMAGWMEMHIWDYRTEEERSTRVSYIQDFFDDLLWGCYYLLSPIIGIYEIEIDQEGYDSSIKFYKWETDREATMTVELRIPVFSDEDPKDNEELIDNILYYHNISIKTFVRNLINLIEKYKKEYNEGFVLSPSNELNEKLLAKVKRMFRNKYKRWWQK